MSAAYNSKVRVLLAGQGRKLKPNWHTYHELGIQLMPLIPTHCTLRAIGKEFGITHQMAYHEVAVALGKLAYRMREQHPDWKSC